LPQSIPQRNRPAVTATMRTCRSKPPPWSPAPPCSACS
jgi:hypothetical protein